MKRLYELAERQNILLYYKGYEIIFDHLDGMYSYCWFKGEPEKVVHILAYSKVEKYKEGYKVMIDEIQNE